MLSLVFAFLCMHFTGIPANLLSLGALDFGIIVDGAVIVLENFAATLQQALAMLARVLTEPVTMFARAVKAVADQQGGGEAAPDVASDAAPEAAPEAPAETA